MDIQNLEEIIDNWDNYQNNKRKKKYKLNHYKRKLIDRLKLKKLSKYAFTVYFNEELNRYIRYYLSSRKKKAKWYSDKVVRNRNNFPLKGTGYRKCFDYWYYVI